MGRPPLPIGAHGAIRHYPHPHPDGKQWRATTKFRDADGTTRPVSRIGKSKAAAERALKAVLVERAAGTGDQLGGETRFKAVAPLWLEEVRRTRAATTYDTYRLTLGHRVLPAFGDLQLREITVPVVHRWLRGLEAELQAATIRGCRKVVSGVLAFAVQQGAIPTNPVREAGRIEGKSKPVRALTREERADVLMKLDLDERARADDLPDLVRFMLGTGMRIGEVLGLRWWRVDLDAREIVAGPVLVRHAGQGLVLHDGGKTRASLRILPIPDFTYWMLRARMTGEPDPLAPVFPNMLGTWRDPHNTGRSLRKWRGPAGYDWLTSHVFRKTAATVMDEQGLSAREIAAQLGHARPSITMDVYMDLRSQGRSAARALDQAMTVEPGSRR